MVNHMVLQGRLVADPELRNTQSGIPVCSFRVAWSEKYKETESKLFLSCTAWSGLGEMISKYFSKGQEISVEGKLCVRDWQDKNGNNRQSIEMTVEKAHFCGPRKDSGSSCGYHMAGAPVPVSGEDFRDISDEDDSALPF